MYKYFYFSSIFLMCLLLSVVSCTFMDKDSQEARRMVESINAKYYNVRSAGVKEIVFEYKSQKFNNLVRQLSDQKLADAMENLKNEVLWKGGARVSVRTDNVPNSKNEKIKEGIGKMVLGLQEEIKGTFMVLSPILDKLLTYNRRIKIVADDEKNEVVVEVDHGKKGMEKLYFDSNYKLIKSEVSNKGKIVSQAKFNIVNYNNKYLINGIYISVFSDTKIKTNLNIEYAIVDGVNLPSKLALLGSINDQAYRDTITLVPVVFRKQE